MNLTQSPPPSTLGCSLLEKRGLTTEQVILCYESLVGMVPTFLSSLSLGVGAPNQDFGSQRAEESKRGVQRHTLKPWLHSTVDLRNTDGCQSSVEQSWLRMPYVSAFAPVSIQPRWHELANMLGPTDLADSCKIDGSPQILNGM